MGNYLFSSDDRMAVLESRIEHLESCLRENNREKYDVVGIINHTPQQTKSSVRPSTAPWHNDLMAQIQKRRKSLKPVVFLE